MGIYLQSVDSSNVLQVILLYRSPNILKWIPAQLVNSENCLAAVRANGLALKSVPENLATATIILEAIQQNHQSLWTLPKPMMTKAYIEAATHSFIKQCQAARYLRF